MELHCGFVYFYDGDLYTCSTSSANIVEPATRIKAIRAVHLRGKSNSDVERFYFHDTIVKFVPKGLNMIFYNLVSLHIQNCCLRVRCLIIFYTFFLSTSPFKFKENFPRRFSWIWKSWRIVVESKSFDEFAWRFVCKHAVFEENFFRSQRHRVHEFEFAPTDHEKWSRNYWFY